MEAAFSPPIKKFKIQKRLSHKGHREHRGKKSKEAERDSKAPKENNLPQGFVFVLFVLKPR